MAISSIGSAWVTQLSAAAATQGAADWLGANASSGISDSLGIKKSAVLQSFMANGASLAGAFANISQAQTDGLAKLAAQAAITRAQTEHAKKLDELTNIESADSVPLRDRVDLPNGSTLDLTANTFTLPDGTVLDVTTGRQVDKLA